MPCIPTGALPRKVWPMNQSLHEGMNEVSQITISQTPEEMQDMKNFFRKRFEPACDRAHQGLGDLNAKRWAKIDMTAWGCPRVLYNVMSADWDDKNLEASACPNLGTRRCGKPGTRSTVAFC